MLQMCRREPGRVMVWGKCLTNLFKKFSNPSVSLQLDRVIEEHSKITRPGRSNTAMGTILRSNELATLN
jgi:hypothetical protein